MQFLLGVDAPVELRCSLRQILATIAAQRAARDARLRARAPLAAAGAARGPAAPPAPRLHDRRPVAALARMIEPVPSPGPAPADHAAARAARRDPRRHRVRAVRDRLLPPVVPAGAVRRPVPAAGARQPRARASRPGAARRDPRPQRQRARREPRRDRRRSSTRAAAAGRARRRGDVGPADDRARQAPEGPARASRSRSRRRRRRSSSARSRSLAARARHVAAHDPASAISPARSSTLPYANVRVKVDVASQSMRNYLLEHQRGFPGVAVQRVYLRRYPRGHAGCAAARARSGRSTPDELEDEALPRRAAGHGRRPGRPRALLRPLPARDRRRRRASPSTRSAARRRSGDRARAGGRAQRCARRSTSGLQRTAQRCLRQVIGRAPARPAAFVALDPRNGRSSRWAPTRPSTRRCSRGRSRSRATTRSSATGTARRCSTARSPAAIRPARRSSRSRRSPRSSAASITPDDADQRHRLPQGRHRRPGCVQRRRRGRRHGQPAPRAAGLLRRLLLHAGPRLNRARRARRSRSWARKLGLGHRDRHRPPRRGRRHRPRPRLARRRTARKRRVASAKHRKRAASPTGLRQAAVVGGRQHQPRRRPGRPAGLAAADGGRVRGDRQRRPRRAAAPGRWRSRTTGGRVLQRIEPGARSASRSTRRTARRSSTACTGDDWPTAPPRTSSRAGTQNALPGLRQDRHRRAPRPTQRPVLVRRLRPEPDAADRDRGDGRGRRLRRRGRRADRLPIMLASGSARRRQVRRRAIAHELMAPRRHHADPRRRRRPGRRAARPVGLHAAVRPGAAARGDRAAASPRWSSLRGATADDVPGDPHYFVTRQAIYFVVGARAGRAALRGWTTRACARSSTSSTAC